LTAFLPKVEKLETLSIAQALNTAVRTSALETVKFLLKHGADPRGRDERDKTAVALTLEFTDPQKMRQILEIIAKHTKATFDLQPLLQTPDTSSAWLELHDIVRSRNLKRLSHVLESYTKNGHDLNKPDASGFSFLHYATEGRSWPVVEVLLEAGADPSVKDQKGRSCLHFAAEKGNVKIAQGLLEFGADMDAKDNSNQTAMHYPAMKGSSDITKLLVEWRADISPKDRRRQTPMHFAAGSGNITVVKFLVECVSKISELDSKLRSPLFIACINGRVPTVKLLMEYGSDGFIPDIQGQTPLHVAAINSFIDIMRLLLAGGANPSPKDNRGRTPLHEGAFCGGEKIVELLLQYQADHRVQDNEGRTPLHDACRSCNDSERVVQQLLEKGNNYLVADHQGCLPIHYAARYGKTVVTEQLLEAVARTNPKAQVVSSAYLNSQDLQGQTLLHMAVRVEHDALSILKLLVDHGIKRELRDINGKTALQLAVELKRKDAIIFLMGSAQPPKEQPSKGNHKYVYTPSSAYSAYTYTPLLPSETSRVLRLHPPRREDKKILEDDPIVCSFTPLALYESEDGHLNSAIEYEALSYWWGTDKPRTENEIKIFHWRRGLDSKYPIFRINPLYVRSNLYSALRQLRHPDKVVTLWVDALCIDQQSKHERSTHVMKIKDIYAAASQVRIWLGPSNEMSAKAFSFLSLESSVRHWSQTDPTKPRSRQNSSKDNGLRRVDPHIISSQRQETRPRFPPVQTQEQPLTLIPESPEPLEKQDCIVLELNPPGILDSDGSSIEEHVHALAALLRNRWFTRRWILQEVFFAKNVVLQCGSYEGNWNRFLDTISHLNEMTNTHFPPTEQASSFFNLRLSGATTLALVSMLRSSASGRSATPKQTAAETREAEDITQRHSHVIDASTGSLFDPRYSLARHKAYCLCMRAGVHGTVEKAWKNLSLESLVPTLVHFKVWDPRDAIYSLLGLAKDKPNHWSGIDGANWISPDYTKPFVEVFIEFVRYCIMSSKSLNVICRPWAPKPQRRVSPDFASLVETFRKFKNEGEKAIELPSWIIPASNGPFGTEGLESRSHGDSLVGLPELSPYNASKGKLPSVKFPSVTRKLSLYFNGAMHVRGRRIAAIADIGPRAIQGMIFKENLEMMGWSSGHDGPSRELDTQDRSSESISLTDVPDQVWRTLVADRGPAGQPVEDWYKDACRESISKCNSMGDIHTSALIAKGEENSQLVQYLKRVQSVIWNRKFFRTENSQVGVAPGRAFCSDIVCILWGCDVPVLLRRFRNGGDAEQFELIGECYVYGLMDGEALEMFEGQADQEFVLR